MKNAAARRCTHNRRPTARSLPNLRVWLLAQLSSAHSALCAGCERLFAPLLTQIWQVHMPAGDKYMLHTYQASVRAKVNGRSQVNKTKIRAMNAQDARWLLWAQYGFQSIQAGPAPIAQKK